jgi:predicted HicB family RNase H-like nuclease
MSGKFGDIIRKARESEQEPESQNAGKPENQKEGQESVLVVEKEKDVNLSIKVPEPLRRHWVSEAKRQGTSLTAAITEALIEKFGKPD